MSNFTQPKTQKVRTPGTISRKWLTDRHPALKPPLFIHLRQFKGPCKMVCNKIGQLWSAATP